MQKVSKEEYVEVVNSLVRAWAKDLPDDMLRRASMAPIHIRVVDDPGINAYMGTVMNDWFSREPREFVFKVTEGFLEFISSLGPELARQALAGVMGHEAFHMTQNLDTSRPNPLFGMMFFAPKGVDEEFEADVEGIKLAEKAGFTRAREGVVAAFTRLVEMNDGGPDVVRRLGLLRAGS